MSSAQREFDIVLYSATGFSGMLTAQHLAQRDTNARIALAGRSPQRLRAVRDKLGPLASDWPLVVADASQPATLEEMATRAQVILTTVGPYTRYGLPLVAACAKAGTDYADLTGELMFCRNSIDLYHKQAADTGARIVLACGFDSIPSDLNVHHLYRRAAVPPKTAPGNWPRPTWCSARSPSVGPPAARWQPIPKRCAPHRAIPRRTGWSTTLIR